jgi:putative ABC transport system permease protein
LIVVLPALVRASRVSVTQSMADFGVGRALFGNSAVERWISSLDSWGEFSSYALRNALRRRSRFLLSLALLASAGAIFLAAMNTARSWEVLTERLYVSRHYDFEVGFTGSVEAEALAGELAELKEITAVEVWESTRTALGSGEVVPIEMTYPDGAHGAFSLVAPPLGHGVLRCEGGMFSSGG